MTRSLVLALLTCVLGLTTAAPCLADWPYGRPAFRAPATLIDATPGNIADQQQILDVAVADIDGNGLDDVCVRYQNTVSSTVSTHLAFVMNKKSPNGPMLMSWPTAIPGYVPLPGSGPDGLALGDMNNDKRADVVTFSAASGIIRVQISTGAGFAPPIDFVHSGPWNLRQIQLADRDADGLLDVIVRFIDPAIPPGESVATARNTGGGHLAHQNYMAWGLSPVSMKIAYADADSFPDLLVNDGVRVWLHTSLDAYFSGAGYAVGGGLGEQVFDYIAARLDGDAYSDLIVLSRAGGPAHVYVYSAFVENPPWPPPSYTVLSDWSRHLGAADMDGNGIAEIYVTSPQSAMGPSFPRGCIEVVDLGSPYLENHVYLSPGRLPGPCTFGDVDGDHNPDLVVGLSGTGDHNVAIIQDLSAASRGIDVGFFGDYNNLGSPAVADFNRDAKPDLAVPSGAETQIMIGTGGGEFMPGTTTLGEGKERLYTLDANRDAKPDLLHDGADRIRIQLGNGDGSFQGAFNAVTLGTDLPRHPFADFNRDGIQDAAFLVKTPGAWGAGIALGDGSGVFPTLYGSLGGFSAPPTDAVAVDLERDGDLDLIVATQSGIRFLLNTGLQIVDGGSWFDGRDFRTIAAGDLNRDGKVDIVAHERISGPYDRRKRGIHIFYTDGIRQVALTDSLGANERLGNMLEISDVNRDGLPDIVDTAVDDGLDPFGAYWLPTGAGVFLQKPFSQWEQRVDYAQGYVTPGGFALLTDANGDRQPDVVSMNMGTSNAYGNAVQISPGNSFDGAWSVSGQTDYLGTVNPMGMAWGDMNRDGTLDLVVSDRNGGIFIYFTDQYGTLNTPPYSVPTGPVDDVALADLNGDGRLDVFAAAQSGAVLVLLGQGNGALTAPVAYTAASGGLSHIKIGDLNRDGKPDLVVIGSGAQVSVFLGGNNGTIFMSQAIPLIAPGKALDLADMNRDGILDLILLQNENAPIVWVALGTGAGAFAGLGYAWGLQDSGWPNGIAAGDVNNDGKMDIAASFDDGATNPVYLLYGDGAGGFGSHVSYPGTTLASILGFGYLNGDPYLDLVVSSSEEGVSVRLGDAAGGLGSMTWPGYASVPYGFAIADLNRDGANDLAVTDGANGIVSVLFNSQSNITAVAEGKAPKARPTLAQNTPNPFNPRTSIKFTLTEAGPVRLAVYDVQGRRVTSLVDRTLGAGAHRVDWDGRVASGGYASSGVYFYRLETGGHATSRRMVLLK